MILPLKAMISYLILPPQGHDSTTQGHDLPLDVYHLKVMILPPPL